jgi:hypothetical protein
MGNFGNIGDFRPIKETMFAMRAGAAKLCLGMDY